MPRFVENQSANFRTSSAGAKHLAGEVRAEKNKLYATAQENWMTDQHFFFSGTSHNAAFAALVGAWQSALLPAACATSISSRLLGQAPRWPVLYSDWNLLASFIRGTNLGLVD